MFLGEVQGSVTVLHDETVRCFRTSVLHHAGVVTLARERGGEELPSAVARFDVRGRREVSSVFQECGGSLAVVLGRGRLVVGQALTCGESGVSRDSRVTPLAHFLVESVLLGFEPSFLPCGKNIVGLADDIEAHHGEDAVGRVVLCGNACVKDTHNDSGDPDDE